MAFCDSSPRWKTTPFIIFKRKGALTQQDLRNTVLIQWSFLRMYSIYLALIPDDVSLLELSPLEFRIIWRKPFLTMHFKSFSTDFCSSWCGFPGDSDGKDSACNVGDPGLTPQLGRCPEKEMATHSSILAWRIPWTEEPGGLPSMGSQKVGHDWVTNTHYSYTYFFKMEYSLVQFSCSVVSNSLWPQEPQHTSPPCLSPTPRVQTHVHRVNDAIQPSHPLSSPSPSALNLSQHQGLFQ